METSLFIVWFFIILTSITIELLTLYKQMCLVYLNQEKVNRLIYKNWKLIFIYGLIAVIATPITIISVIFGVREVWEKKLFNSIKNNLYTKEKV